jgi:single stranded DNA-binding protein
MAVVSFGIATNRVWVTKQGERKEDAQFHRIVAWNKLAELCSQLLAKGRRVYVEGRIQYREYTDAENNKRQISEIVIDDMIILDNKGSNGDRNHDSMDLSGGEDMAASTGGSGDTQSVDSHNDNIEDIVIPDDVGKVDEEPVKTEEEPAKAEEDEKKTEEDKKDDEMPF